MKMLIAEDDMVARHALNSALQRWGYEVITAGNGLEAWNLMKKDAPPNLMILDWMMPEMDGIELTARLRQDPRFGSVYILMLTSRSTKEEGAEALHAGAD